MKRSELTTGQRVALRWGQDWRNSGIYEAIVLDTDTLYESYRYGLGRSNDPIRWPDPRDPSKDVKMTVRRVTGNGGKVAVLVHKRSWGDDQWQPELAALGSIVGPYEECKAEVDRAKAEKLAGEREKADRQRANKLAFAQLKADYPQLHNWRVNHYGDGNVTLPVSLLRELLEGGR